MSKSNDEKISDAQKVIGGIRPLLRGKVPDVQSIVLADLLATYIAGYRPDLRDEVLAMHLKLVRDLIPENEKEIFGEKGWHER